MTLIHPIKCGLTVTNVLPSMKNMATQLDFFIHFNKEEKLMILDEKCT